LATLRRVQNLANYWIKRIEDGNPNGGTFAHASLSNLTIANGKGNDGGAIYNNGTLTLTNCTLSGNSATYEGGGIFKRGTATLTNCTDALAVKPLGHA